MENTPGTPSITQYRCARAQDAEIEALLLENDRLRDPELPEYVLLWGIIAKGTRLTADQIIDRALLHRDFAESCDAPMCLDMCEAFLEYVEGRTLARAAEQNTQPPIVLTFRLRKPRS
jgi:hypothetical protein